MGGGRFCLGSITFTAAHQVPEVVGPVNSRRAREPEHLSVIGVVVHLYWQAVVRVLESAQGWRTVKRREAAQRE